MVRGVTKGREKKPLAKTGEQQAWEYRGIKVSSGWSSVNGLLGSMLAWLCPIPLFCLLVKGHFKPDINPIAWVMER